MVHVPVNSWTPSPKVKGTSAAPIASRALIDMTIVNCTYRTAGFETSLSWPDLRASKWKGASSRASPTLSNLIQAESNSQIRNSNILVESSTNTTVIMSPGLSSTFPGWMAL